MQQIDNVCKVLDFSTCLNCIINQFDLSTGANEQSNFVLKIVQGSLIHVRHLFIINLLGGYRVAKIGW